MLLQSFGRGDLSLAFTFFKQIVLTLIFIFIFLTMSLGETGVYLGIVVANFVGSLIQLLFTRDYVKKIQQYF